MYVDREVWLVKQLSAVAPRKWFPQRLPNSAALHVFARFADRLTLVDLRHIHKKKRNVRRRSQKWQLKHVVVLPLARRIDQRTRVSRNSLQEVFKKLKHIEDYIHIIAREIPRQSKRSE